MLLKTKPNLEIILVLLSYLLYLIFFLIPYASDHGFFNENIVPSGREKLIYSLLSIPILIVFSAYVFSRTQKITYYRSLIYPLLIIDGYLGFIMCLIIQGGAILWLVMFTIFIPAILMLVSAANGSKKDMEYLRNNGDQNNEEE